MTGQCVVVTFGSAADGYCSLSNCPMDAYGPFENHDQAVKFADTRPDWEQPHILRLETATVPTP